mmetsp:Transcript_27995/g.39433  ORF Transcript_27995/g.39433 Transcript_27995/m.39433 type:complete len:231 (+) Transcript_27995:29-721(+)
MSDENLFAMPAEEGEAPEFAAEFAAEPEAPEFSYQAPEAGAEDGDMFIVPGPGGEMPPSEADDAAFLGNVDETAPPAEDAPIILGGVPPEEAAPAISVEEASVELEPAEPAGPSPMQVWNEEWQETLKNRKDAENALKAEYLEAAQASLDEFKAQKEAKRESRMASNRSDEQEKLEAIEADLENDNSWQRVCKMVELSHDAADGAADVGRMKDVLITLKNDTTRAVTLGA